MSVQKPNYKKLAEKHFPAPEFRKNQKEVTVEALKQLYEEDKDAVLIDAPPGFGKSIVLYTIMKAGYEIAETNNITPKQPEGGWMDEPRMTAENCETGGFYVTPLKTLQKQLQEDEFIGNDVIQIKGRSNYDCIIEDKKVNKAKCQRDEEFDCDVKQECPYYKTKKQAIEHHQTVMNLSYMMAEGYVPENIPLSFGDRETITVDECQGLPDWALGFVEITISKNTVPDEVWNNIQIPKNIDTDDVDKIVKWMKDEVKPITNDQIEHLDKITLQENELTILEQLKKFRDKINRFIKDQEENEWICQIEDVINKNKKNYRKLKLKPIKVGRFLEDLIHDRGNKIIMSSATIPKGNWLEEVGLDDKDVCRLNIPSNFPVKNRPIITDRAVGKMTYNERDDTITDMVEDIYKICQEHEGQKGLVHCRGYNYIQMFKNTCYNTGYRDWYKENVMIQKREDREGSLERWKKSDKQLFLSVNMAEGIDLKGDLCRFQILLKTLYPNMGDKRTKYRVQEMNDWKWYNTKAVTQLEQAYGRGVRSKDDWCKFYLLDESAKSLINRNSYLFHDWFLEGIVDMDI